MADYLSLLEFISDHNVLLLAVGVASGCAALEMYFQNRERCAYEKTLRRSSDEPYGCTVERCSTDSRVPPNVSASH